MTKPGLKSLSLRGALVLGLAGAAVLGLQHPPRAEPPGEPPPAEIEEWQREFEILEEPDFRVIPLQEAARAVSDRFRGRLIAARLRLPTPDERSRGVELVHELRLLTPARDVLMIRLDARTGDFLEVRGAGLAEARRHKGERE